MLKMTLFLLLAGTIAVGAQTAPSAGGGAIADGKPAVNNFTPKPPVVRQHRVPQEFVIRLSPAQVDALGAAIAWAPKREADPLTAAIQQQVNDQVAQASAPRNAYEEGLGGGAPAHGSGSGGPAQ
jgi:hypothetical protein